MEMYFILNMIQKGRKQKCQIEQLLYPLSTKEKPKANYSQKNYDIIRQKEQTVKQKNEEKASATESIAITLGNWKMKKFEAVPSKVKEEVLVFTRSRKQRIL